MSFVASRNRDFPGPTADLENKKDLIGYSWVFFSKKLQRLRIWIDFVYLVCSFHKCRSSNEVLSLICT